MNSTTERPATADTPLTEFIDGVLITSDATQKTIAKLDRLVRYISDAIRCQPKVSDLNVTVLAALAHTLRAKWKLSVSYANYIKQWFRSVWRVAAEQGLIPDLPRSVYGYRYGTRRASRRRVLTDVLRQRIEKAAAMRGEGVTWEAIGNCFRLSAEAIRGWQKRHRECWEVAYAAKAADVAERLKQRAAEIEERRRQLFLDAVKADATSPHCTGTVEDLLQDYLAAHDVAKTTADYYRRMVKVLNRWACGPVPLDSFTVRLVNRMLQDFQIANKAAYYRKTVRSAMRSLLAHRNDGILTGKLRTVRVDPLEPEVWTAEEIQRLINTCNYMRSDRKRLWWQTLIAVGYFTGLSNGDLWRVRRADIDATGVVRLRRNKTRKPIAMRIPNEWLARLSKLARRDEPIWGRPMAEETFRETFARIVGKAKLTGSFKRLRKSCGTSVEMQHPGKGHIALGNSARVFEQHYFSRREIDKNPVGPMGLPG